MNTTEVTRWQCSVSFGWQPTGNDPTSPPVDLWGVPGGSAMDVAGGGRCRDERRRGSASEVGTDDGTAKNTPKNTPQSVISERTQTLQ